MKNWIGQVALLLDSIVQFYLEIIQHFVSFSETRQFFDDLCVKHNVDCSPPRTTTRLLDKVCFKAIL